MTTERTATSARASYSPSVNVQRIRDDFPILAQKTHGKPLVYFDNAATAQKPRSVIETLSNYYGDYNANIHRGVHTLSVRATDAYERARAKVQRFINAAQTTEVIFTHGTTDAINLLAQTFGRTHVNNGDEIVISTLEHHSNIVPWQILCQQTGAQLRIAPIDDRGELVFEGFERLLHERTKLIAIAHVSNALGTILPAEAIVESAHRRGIPVFLDGAQAVPHFRVDVQALNCDFYAFSSHKMFGPTGVGVLYGKRRILDELPPYQGGGDMIKSVTFAETIYNDVPYRFEAGTPDIAGVIGLGAAIDYLDRIGMDSIAAYEDELLDYATQALSSVPSLRIIGTARNKVAVLSFILEGVHAHDLGTILDQLGIAVRTGHHCAQPAMDRFAVPATARASLAFYNTKEEIDALVVGLTEVLAIFG